MKYIVDIDNTICISENSDYNNSVPITSRIRQLNKLFDEGHQIHYWTARGMSSGIDWSAFTYKQFSHWGVKYHTLSFGKPSYDVWIDDKAINDLEFFDDSNNRN